MRLGRSYGPDLLLGREEAGGGLSPISSVVVALHRTSTEEACDEAPIGRDALALLLSDGVDWLAGPTDDLSALAVRCRSAGLVGRSKLARPSRGDASTLSRRPTETCRRSGSVATGAGSDMLGELAVERDLVRRARSVAARDRLRGALCHSRRPEKRWDASIVARCQIVASALRLGSRGLGMASVVLATALRLPCRRPGSIPNVATPHHVALVAVARLLWAGRSEPALVGLSSLQRGMKTKTYMECARSDGRWLTPGRRFFEPLDEREIEEQFIKGESCRCAAGLIVQAAARVVKCGWGDCTCLTRRPSISARPTCR